jgi:hypothetical protein
MLGAASDDVANLFKMGTLLASLMDLQQRTGCTIVLLHHCPKHAPYAEPELDNAAYAGSSEAARQWILLARRCAYDGEQPGHHELWFSIGGSMGHSELLALNIDEGSRKDPGGRRFELDLISAGEARADAAAAGDDAKEEKRQAREQAQLDGDRAALVVTMEGLKGPETKSGIRDLGNVPPVRFGKAWASLLMDETIVPLGTIRKGNNQPHDGYCLARQVGDFRSRQMSSEAVRTGSDDCVDAVVVSPSIRGLTNTASLDPGVQSQAGQLKADECKP